MTRARSTLLLSFFFVLFLLSSCWAWQGQVVGISDGDTITVLHDGKGESVRLYGVDTPDSRQDYGRKAKAFISDMVLEKTVEVKPFDTDHYGRTVGMVYVDGGKCLNEELLRAGFAWFYERYCNRPHCKEWKELEKSARDAKLGLWAGPNPVPPWEFRRASGSQTSGSEIKPATGEATPATTSTGGRSRAAIPAESGPYHGDVASKVFHKQDCQQYNCKNCIAIFERRIEAIKAGYRPCEMCKP